jgi:DNA-binding CsgD family transcriptional regulator/tetratricopeptide (TPR) repeat protein
VLEDALRSVAHGDSQVVAVLLGGDAGIGKSRLVDEFRSRARSTGVLVATGACVPTNGGGLPYGPFVGILRDLVRQLDHETASGVLGPAISGLGLDLPGFDRSNHSGNGEEPPGSSSALGKTRLFSALLGSFANLSEASPVVLVLEDLHWADSASAELLDFLARNLQQTSVMLIGTYRSDELGGRHPLRGPLIELGRHMHVIEIRLQGLDIRDTATLLTAILGEQPESALVTEVQSRSEGNPFFVEELMAAMPSTRISDELRRMILLRVDRMSESARQLVGVAAAIGVQLDQHLLETVSELGAERFDHALAEVLDHQILVAESEAGVLRFRHTLLFEAASGMMLRTELVRVHRKIATTLLDHPDYGKTGPGHRAAEQARHWWAAGAWSEALSASVEAGEAASAVFAFAEALEQFERALAAWDLDPDAAMQLGRDRGAILEAAADAAYFAGHAQRAVELSAAAVDTIDEAVDPVRKAVCLTRLGRNSWAVGESQAPLDALAEAMRILPTDRPSVELAHILAEQGRGLMLLSRFSEARECCERAIVSAREVGARAEEGHALNTLGVLRAQDGDHAEGIALMRAALEIAEEVGDPDDLNRAYANLCHVWFVSGRLEESAAVTLDSMAMGEALGGVRLNAAALNSADSLLQLGRWGDAETLVRDVELVSGNCGMHRELLQAEIALRRGQFEKAGEYLGVVDERTKSLDDVQFRGDFHMLRASLALEEERPLDAFDDVERALALSAATEDTFFTPEMCMLGVQALADRLLADRTLRSQAEGEADTLRELAAGLVEKADDAAVPKEPGRSGLPQPHAYALTCRAEETRLHRSDPSSWHSAAQAWEDLSQPYQTAYCRWREAEALLTARGKRSSVMQSLSAAWRIASDLGAEPLRRRIEQLALRARIPLDKARPDLRPVSAAGDLGLTSREIEVLGRLAAGRSDRQIAEELFISKKTASVHVSNILRKLHATKRIEAGEIGQRVGLH